MDLMDFDGCSEIYVRKWEDWENFMNVRRVRTSLPSLVTNEKKSEEFQKALNPDADHFMAMPIQVSVARENLIFGEAIPGMSGRVGVTEGNVKTRS